MITPERLALIEQRAGQKSLCELEDGIYTNGNVTNPVPELCAEIARLNVRVSDLKGDKDRLQVSVSDLNAELTRQKAKVAELRTEIDNLRFENKALRKKTSGGV